MLVDSLGLAISAAPMQDDSSAGSAVYFVVELTPLGRDNVELVLDLLYAYIAVQRRKGVGDDLYKSLARIDKLEWDWQEAGGPSDTASNYAEAITRLPAKSADGRWSDLGPRPRAGV